MALPLLKSIQDCSDYSKTVEPFLPQLYQLPSKLLDNITSPSGLQKLYLETNPLISALGISIGLGFVFLVVSEINRNYSQVDRMWSILPNLYVIHFAVWARLAGLAHSRLDLISVATTLWSIRLTFNYWRKGGYTVGSEDYRWAIVRNNIPGIAFFILNVTFIAFFQSVLLFAFSAVPTYAIMLSTKYDQSITTADLFYFASQVALVVVEFVSDGQQWNFHAAKEQYKKDGKIINGYKHEEVERGFNTSGLWAYSRHPNFAAEQSFWFVLYQWSCMATNSLYSYTGTGAVALILLFQGSTWLTELITTGKYTEYPAYQKQVGMFIPKSLTPFKKPVPKVIRTSDLAKRQDSKKQK